VQDHVEGCTAVGVSEHQLAGVIFVHDTTG